MMNPLVEVVEREFSQLGISDGKLVRESYNPQNFGNAEAIYNLNHLKLRFVRDRGADTIDIGSSSSSQYIYNFEDVAVWMGWISLDDLLQYDTPINFDKPPPGPIFNTTKALSLISRNLMRLDNAFSPSELMSTDASLKDIERRRILATGLS